MNKMRRTAETFARSARKQQEGFRIIAEGWSDAYEGFVISPFDYAQEGIRMFQRAAEQGVTVTQRVVKQGWSPPSMSPGRGCGSPRRPPSHHEREGHRHVRERRQGRLFQGPGRQHPLDRSSAAVLSALRRRPECVRPPIHPSTWKEVSANFGRRGSQKFVNI